MKNKKRAVEIDFIGGQPPLTTKEAKELSEYFQRLKPKVKKSIIKAGSKRKSLSKA